MAWPRAWALSPLFSLLPGVHVKTPKRQREEVPCLECGMLVCVCVCVLMRVLVSNGTLRIAAASQAKHSKNLWSCGLRFLSGTSKEYLQLSSARDFSHASEFILYVRVVRSPCGAFSGLQQNLEGIRTDYHI